MGSRDFIALILLILTIALALSLSAIDSSLDEINKNLETIILTIQQQHK